MKTLKKTKYTFLCACFLPTCVNRVTVTDYRYGHHAFPTIAILAVDISVEFDTLLLFLAGHFLHVTKQNQCINIVDQHFPY